MRTWRPMVALTLVLIEGYERWEVPLPQHWMKVPIYTIENNWPSDRIKNSAANKTVVLNRRPEAGFADQQEVLKGTNYIEVDSEKPYVFPDRPAAKSSTSVAAASTVCPTCGCRKGPGVMPKQNCRCACHPRGTT